MIMVVGKGVHYFLGSPSARLEGEIALDVLFQRFPDDIALIEPNPVDLLGCTIFFPLHSSDSFTTPHTH
jgi:cytochrome P450